MPADLKPEARWLSSCMGMACAGWGWSADEFWNATPFDLALIVEGLTSRHGHGFGADDAAYLRSLLDEQKR